MGSKPSGVKGGVVVAASVEGGEDASPVVHVPKQVQIASAPPTPLRPDGAPVEDSDDDPFPPSPGAAKERPMDLSLSKSSKSVASESGRGAGPHATHSGATGGWPNAKRIDAEKGGESGGPTQDPASASPPASSLDSPAPSGAIRFDASLEEVLQQATEAFGSIASALSSPKWDRRVQALKGVGTVLKGLDIKAEHAEDRRGLKLRDNSSCFRAACLILNVALKDKVLPVLFAAHELYRVTFEHGAGLVPKEEASHAMATLLQHVLAKLGELNIRLHESACSALVFSAGPAPRLALPVALDTLQRHINDTPMRGQQKMRVHAGVLDAVSQLLRRFPGRRSSEGDEPAAATWSATEVAPFVVVGTQVDAATGERVRQAAASLAVLVYTALGKRSLDEVMAQLPEAAKDIVKQRIEEETGMLIDDGDFEDMGEEGDDCEEKVLGGQDVPDLCVMGVALKPPSTAGQRANLVKTEVQEEDFMDEILEETGMVFQGTGLLNVNGKESSATNPALDEDLRKLGLLDGPALLS